LVKSREKGKRNFAGIPKILVGLGNESQNAQFLDRMRITLLWHGFGKWKGQFAEFVLALPV
jgi:hypothetical protein